MSGNRRSDRLRWIQISGSNSTPLGSRRTSLALATIPDEDAQDATGISNLTNITPIHPRHSSLPSLLPAGGGGTDDEDDEVDEDENDEDDEDDDDEDYVAPSDSEAVLRLTKDTSSKAKRNFRRKASRMRPFLASLPADKPLLGRLDHLPSDPPELDARVVSLVATYIGAEAYSPAANEYTIGDHAHEEIFIWWLNRTLDRLRRKLRDHSTTSTSAAPRIPLDEHEMVLRMLLVGVEDYAAQLTLAYIPSVVNYFAERMVPRGGFTARQVYYAEKDPKRWEKVQEREGLWAEEADYDRSRASERQWRDHSREKANAFWADREAKAKTVAEAARLRRKTR